MDESLSETERGREVSSQMCTSSFLGQVRLGDEVRIRLTCVYGNQEAVERDEEEEEGEGEEEEEE